MILSYKRILLLKTFSDWTPLKTVHIIKTQLFFFNQMVYIVHVLFKTDTL